MATKVLLLRTSLLRLTSGAAGLPLPLIDTVRAPSNNASLHLYGLGRSGTKFPQASVPRTFLRNLSTEHSSPPLHSSEFAPTSPTNSDIFESSSQELWAADAARTLEEGETLASLGLGGYSPVGLVQTVLDMIHSTTGLPWWVSIVAATLCIKLACVPLSIYARENAIKMHKINPQVELIKGRQKTYLLARDLDRANQEKAKLDALFKEHGVRPILVMMPTIVQGVVMCSFFLAIRKMAYAPIASMMTGGTLWFVDLTLSDPTYMLPVISSALLIANLELGGEVGVSTPQMENMKWILRLVSIGMIIPVSHFPSGLIVFWISSNSFTICYSLVMKAIDSIKGTTTAKPAPTDSQNPRRRSQSFLIMLTWLNHNGGSTGCSASCHFAAGGNPLQRCVEELVCHVDLTRDYWNSQSDHSKAVLYVQYAAKIRHRANDQKTRGLIAAKRDDAKVAKRLYNKQLSDKNPKLYKKKPLHKK